MQRLKYSIYLFLLVIAFFACKDEPLPFETFEEQAKGAFSRLLNTDGGSFLFTDPDNSSFNFDLEYYSENNGGEVAANEWYVSHRNNTAGGVISAPVLLSRTESSSFGTDALSGLPTASFAFTMNQALAALGLTIDDVNGGDDLIFDGFIIMNDGRRFGPDNTGGSVQGGAGFDGVFRFIKPLLCPSELDGTFTTETVVVSTGAGISWDSCDGNTWSGEVRFEQVELGVYEVYSTDPTNGVEFSGDLSFGAFYGCYGTDSNASLPSPDATLYLVESCNNLSFSGSSQWSEVYTFNKVEVSADGTQLTLGWSNDYGEAGESVLTRTDGILWNPGLKCVGC